MAPTKRHRELAAQATAVEYRPAWLVTWIETGELPPDWPSTVDQRVAQALADLESELTSSAP